MSPDDLIELPFHGESLVFRPPGHGRWAFDIMPLGEGRLADAGLWKYLAGRLRAEDVHAWGTPVLSPVDGHVLVAHNGEPDRRSLFPARDIFRPFLSRKDIGMMAGNYLIIESSVGCLLLAHFREGSLQLRPDQAVDAGMVLGEVGNSGNAIAPHLHMQMMDGPDPVSAKPLPFRVRAFEQWDGDAWQWRHAEPLPSTRSRIRAAEGE